MSHIDINSMKKFLVKNALLAFSNESNPSDYFIQNNSITKFDGESLEDVEVIESSELIIFNNLTDTFTAVSEPGFEHRETIEQTILAALDGGFTSLIALPDTEPCIDNRANIEFLMGQSHNSVLKIFPLSTITKEGKGKDLAAVSGISLISMRILMLVRLALLKVTTIDMTLGFYCEPWIM